MPSPLQALVAASLDHTVTIAGVEFKIHALTSRDLAAVGRFQLLVAGVPDPKVADLDQMVVELAREGADARSILDAYVDSRLVQLAERASSERGLAAAQEMRDAVLAAGVTAYRFAAVPAVEASEGSAGTPGSPPSEWCPVRIARWDQPSVPGVDGAPDTLSQADIPGGGAGGQALATAVLSLSGMGPEAVARVARFRRVGMV